MTQENLPYAPATRSSSEATSVQTSPTPKKEKFNYQKYLKQEFTRMIGEVEGLSPQQRDFLRLRWLDQVLWMEGKASQGQQRYYWLRLITIIGGVLVPAFISLGTVVPTVRANNGTSTQTGLSERALETIVGWSPFLSFVLSQAVAIAAATEQFYKPGDRWRNYRRSAELLKSQGWQFLQLSGTYSRYVNETGGGHQKAFPEFAGRIEEIICSDVEGYISQVAQDVKQPKKEGEAEQT